jgi:hypothetical protein
MFFSTGSATASTVTVNLQATVQDVTAFDATDPLAGDIRNARVTFVNRDAASAPYSAACTNITPVLVNPLDSKTGTVSCSVTFDIGSADAKDYTVGMTVNNYYTRDNSYDNAVLTISKLGTGMVTGGGYIVNSASVGSYAGTSGARTNFGFNVKNNKTGKNLQGHVNAIIRRLEGGVWKTYQMTTTATDSLAENITSPTTGTAQFTTKATLVNITNPLAPVIVASGLQLQITVTDNGEPGNTDKVSFTLWNGSTLIYSSNWSGTKTLEQILAGGNLQVR